MKDLWESIKEWVPLIFMLGIMFVALPAALIFGVWNFIDCFNRPIAEAPARCINR